MGDKNGLNSEGPLGSGIDFAISQAGVWLEVFVLDKMLGGGGLGG